MENFKLATQQKLRFTTPKGVLSTEQLWDLFLTDLDKLAVELEKENKEQQGKKSFLVKTSTKDKTSKLKFDVVLDILNTKVEEQQAAAEAQDKKKYNEKINTLLAEKEDDELKNKTPKQLKALLRK